MGGRAVRAYTPRRQNKRWLDGDCPAGVLAIYDNRGKSFDRYTIYYVPTEPLEDRGGPIMYLAASTNPFDAQGFGIHDDMPAYQVAEYRYRAAHDAAKWSELPEDVKRAVRQDLKLVADLRAAMVAGEVDKMRESQVGS